jgi:hypothetical protein
MKKFLLTSALILGASMTFAQDKTEALVIATGKAGGGYDKASHATSTRMSQRGWKNITILNTNGSDEITLAACNGNADIWWSQIDAIYARSLEGCILDPVAFNGAEYAILMFPPDSDNSKLKHIGSDDIVAVDKIGSGTELFWNTVVGIETGDNGTGDDWASAKVANVPMNSKALVSAAKAGKLTAVVMVRKPDNVDILNMLALGWTFGEFYDKDINDQLFNNKPLYASIELELLPDAENYVYEVNSFVGVSPEHTDNDDLRSDLLDSVE